MPRVRLADIIDAIEMEFEEAASFLNFDTGEVETVSHEILRRAEEYDAFDPPDLLTWQEAEWEVAKRIAASERFIELATRFDVHEWSIMRDFCSTVRSESLRDEFVRGIHGRGAFRKFKELSGFKGSSQNGSRLALTHWLALPATGATNMGSSTSRLWPRAARFAGSVRAGVSWTTLKRCLPSENAV